MQLLKEQVIGYLHDGLSIIQTIDDDFLEVEIVIVSQEEWLYWQSIIYRSIKD